MNEREVDGLSVIKEVHAGQIKAKDAAESLNIRLILQIGR